MPDTRGDARAVPGTALRILTWNLFHGRDGLPGLGPTWASTLLGRPVEDGTHVHLNRKLTDLMARRIAGWAPDVCALQEVPTAGIRALVAGTGMRAVWTTTGPLIGPARLRDALAARNPDLWRTHEGNANVLLVGRRIEVVDDDLRSRRLNPWRAVARAARDLRLPAAELARYLPEPRRIVLARLRAPGGSTLVVGCVHCHNARHPEVVGREIALAAEIVREAAGDGPAVLAGDLNARPGHAAIVALGGEGWHGATLDAGGGIDRILSRGLRVVEGPRTLPSSEREVTVSWDGLTRRLRLSDHDPVVAALAVPPATGSAS
jgi:endonuclease/exonuclease/phosphatase family metal-dependent hydrolase